MGEKHEMSYDAEKETEGNASSMTPWEQHSGVINIPRFDYNAPSSLLHHSHPGFLITCPIKREKSATKEAMSILGKFLGASNSSNSGTLGSCDSNIDAKRRKINTEEIDANCVDGDASKNATTNSENAGNIADSTTNSPAKTDAIVERAHLLSLVKLTRSGLLLFTFPKDDSHDIVDIVSNIIQSMESGNLRSPLWCHRIFPIQATCILNEKDLCVVVSRLVFQFLNDKANKLARPIKFAVGYNRRGIEETEMKKKSNLCDMLDRNKCFSVVAAAVKQVASDSIVDLKNPDLSVLVELLPLSGVSNGMLVVAVSVLPQNLVSTKPRLCIKSLLSDSKTKTDKNL